MIQGEKRFRIITVVYDSLVITIIGLEIIILKYKIYESKIYTHSLWKNKFDFGQLNDSTK